VEAGFRKTYLLGRSFLKKALLAVFLGFIGFLEFFCYLSELLVSLLVDLARQLSFYSDLPVL